MDPPFFSPPLPLPRSSTPSPWEEATRRRRRRRKKGKREEESERGEGKIRQERDFEGEYERNCHIWGHTSLDETWMKKKETISLFELVQFFISLVYFRFNPIPLSPRYLSNLPVSFSPHPRAREAFLRSNRARACGPIAFIKAQCHRTRYLRPPCTRTYSLEVSAASIGNRSRRVSPPSAPLILVS